MPEHKTCSICALQDPFSIDLDSLDEFPKNPPFACPGIYVFLDKKGRALYVGESGHIPRRLTEHKRTKKWFGEVASIRATFCPDTEDRLIAETILIFRLRPCKNRAIKIGIRASGQLYPLQFLRTTKK